MRAVSRKGGTAFAPYTLDELPNTNRRTPAFRAASSNTQVPRTFTSMYSAGRSMLGRTPASAARCTMHPGAASRNARSTAPASRMSAWKSRKPRERSGSSARRLIRSG